MANWTITGELGAGKTKLSLYKIKEFLEQNRPVATNIDVYVEHLMPPTSRATITRLIDFPTDQDLWNLGLASNSKNENTFGGLFLDELAVFLNSRDWQGKARDQVIKFLRHVRKQHWHTFFITQDIDSIDKQARNIVEHVVRCKRTDRMTIPILGWLLKLFGMTGKLPQIHLGYVHYGKSQHAQHVETWKFYGDGLNGAYNTDQIFSDDPKYFFDFPTYWKHTRPLTSPVLIPKSTDNLPMEIIGTHSMLSAWHLKGRYLKKARFNLHKFWLLIATISFTFIIFLTIGLIGAQQKKPLVQKIEPIEVKNYLINGIDRTATITNNDGLPVTIPIHHKDEKGDFYIKNGNSWYVLRSSS